MGNVGQWFFSSEVNWRAAGGLKWHFPSCFQAGREGRFDVQVGAHQLVARLLQHPQQDALRVDEGLAQEGVRRRTGDLFFPGVKLKSANCWMSYVHKVHLLRSPWSYLLLVKNIDIIKMK